MFKKYFLGSFIFTIIGAVLAAVFLGGWQAMVIALILGLMETALSFDNAVVNAKQLEKMDEKWRKRFLTWGMVIAVFGMRIVFPLAIVSVITQINPIEALHMAITNPKHYEDVLTSAHVMIAGFGGAFLMMVFLKFFFDLEKDVHWIAIIEKPLAKLGKIESIQVGVALLTLYIVSLFIHGEGLSFIIAGVFGIITYILVDGIGAFLGDGGDSVVKSGVAGFIYLELLDASFSFDGVIGAFALTNNIFLIAIGLGIGAMFVRSLTLLFVDKGVLSTFKFLEHGAFWAIGSLALLMFVGTFVHIPEIVTGTIGAVLIVAALISSLLHNKKEVNNNGN